MVQRENGQHGLESASATEQVAGHRLRCGDSNVLGVLAEGFVDRGCFGEVTGGGAGRVGVNMHHGLGVDVAVFEGFAQRASCAERCGVGRGDVVGVCGDAGTGELCVDACAASLGVLFGLEDEGRCTFTHDEAVAVDVIGTRCLLGLIVTGGERLHLGECRHGQRVDGSLGAANDNHVGLAATNHLGANLHGLGGGCASRDNGLGCRACLEVHRNRGCVAVGHEHRHGHGQDAAGPLFAKGIPGVQEGPHTADTGTEGDTGAKGIDFLGRFSVGAGETCVFPRLASCDEGELSRRIEALGFDLGEAAGFEGFNGKLTGDVDRQVVFLNPGLINRGDTGNALGGVCPGGGDVAADGGGCAEAGHQHFSRHCGTFSWVVLWVVYPVVCG